MGKMVRVWALLLWPLLPAVAAVPAAVREAVKAAYNLWVYDSGNMAVVCTGTLVLTGDGLRFLSAGHCVADWPQARGISTRVWGVRLIPRGGH